MLPQMVECHLTQRDQSLPVHVERRFELWRDGKFRRVEPRYLVAEDVGKVDVEEMASGSYKNILVVPVAQA